MGFFKTKFESLNLIEFLKSCSVLSVDASSVFSLLCDVYFALCENKRESAMACQT